jgi:Flp pilus assembly protein TadD
VSEWEQLARIDSLLDLRRPSEAETAAREFLRHNPGSAQALVLLSRSLTDQDRPQGATNAAREAVLLEPDNPTAHLVHANALLIASKPGEAEAAARESVRLNPHSWATHYTLARTLRAGGQTPEAMKVAHESLALAPHNADIHNLIGLLLRGLGSVAEARRAYSEALRLDPGNVSALNNLASLESGRGKLTRAAGLLRSGLGNDPQHRLLRANHDLVWQLLVRRLWFALLAAGAVLGVELIAEVRYPVRLTTGLLLFTAYVVLTRRVVRNMPRGTRNPRQVWRACRATGRRPLLFLMLGSSVFFTMTFGPQEVAANSASFFFVAVYLLGILVVIGWFFKAITSLGNGASFWSDEGSHSTRDTLRRSGHRDPGGHSGRRTS